jgi:hypothetical protein
MCAWIVEFLKKDQKLFVPCNYRIFELLTNPLKYLRFFGKHDSGRFCPVRPKITIEVFYLIADVDQHRYLLLDDHFLLLLLCFTRPSLHVDVADKLQMNIGIRQELLHVRVFITDVADLTEYYSRVFNLDQVPVSHRSVLLARRDDQQPVRVEEIEEVDEVS